MQTPAKPDGASRSKGYLSPTKKEGPIMPTLADSHPGELENSHARLEHKKFASVSEAQVAVSSPLCERMDFSSRPTKIEVSKDLKTIWYGGEGLGLNQQIHNWFVDQGIVNSELEFCTLKLHTTESGDPLLIVNDFRTWDLAIFDKSFALLHKLKGSGKGAPDFYRSLSVRSWSDNSYIIWLSSPTDVSAVRLSDLVFVTAPDFWLYKNAAVQPIAVLLGSQGDKLVGLGENEGTHSLHVFGQTGDTVVTEMQTIFPRAKMFTSLEFSVDEQLLFVGSSEELTCNSGAAFLVAYSTEGKLKQIAAIEFEETREFNVISCIKRHPLNDVLFLGTRVYVAIVAYHSKQFTLLNQVEVMFEQPVTDMVLRDSLLFVVGDDAKGTIIHF